MAYFKVLSCPMSAGFEEYYEGAVMIPIIWTEILSQYVPDIKQDC